MLNDTIAIGLFSTDIRKTREFYKKLGFRVGSAEDLCGISFGNNGKILITFAKVDRSKEYTGMEIPHKNHVNHVVLSLNVESKSELFEFAENVKIAGGSILGEGPIGNDMEGFSFYSFSFIDIDGYRWDVSYNSLR